MLHLINYTWLRTAQYVLAGTERTTTHKTGWAKLPQALKQFWTFCVRCLKVFSPWCRCCHCFPLTCRPTFSFYCYCPHLSQKYRVTTHARQLWSLWIFQLFTGHWGRLRSIIHTRLPLAALPHGGTRLGITTCANNKRVVAGALIASNQGYDSAGVISLTDSD